MGDAAHDEIEAGDRFAFGENWKQFLDLVDDERIAVAEKSLTEKLGDLSGLRFVDVGSGSGLFSLAARNLGAEVVSFDYDPQSFACAQELRRRYRLDDPGWRVEQGSVLDAEYLKSLGEFDVVYSWGVLHHTGDMWEAVERVGRMTRPGGRLLIALYNDQGPISTFWKAVKRTYVHAGPRGKGVVLGTVGQFLNCRGILVDKVKRRSASPRRGMDRQSDIIDWVGGWPFEVSKPAQVRRFFEDRGFTLLDEWTVGRRMGNNEFMFRRPEVA